MTMKNQWYQLNSSSVWSQRETKGKALVSQRLLGLLPVVLVVLFSIQCWVCLLMDIAKNCCSSLQRNVRLPLLFLRLRPFSLCPRNGLYHYKAL
ncbi:hypothetical protein GDO81_001188 [Engystomops pustulosus]|uniref:Uncharacterized protein n=1 Tax=Engystomops pustulosus TaxID=76066 RepID=A0AAV7DB04_ENGPU|nr:hypothetical protein GDO81_001188 [Engystomops pustulosus]